MEREQNTLNALIDYLKAHGYPPSSIAVEYPIGKYRADLAVVDPDSREPIALFELKRQRTPTSEKFGRMQLASFLSALRGRTIPTYLVFGMEGDPPFEIEHITFEKEEAPSPEPEPKGVNIIDFAVLRESGSISALADKKREQKHLFDLFQVVCWLLAASVFVLVGLDFADKISITSVRLTMIGIGVALVLVPFASKLRILGIEFERIRRETPPRK